MRILDQINIILFHVMYKFLLIYRTFPNSFHKWMLDITVPNRFYHFIQMIRKHDTYLLQYFLNNKKDCNPCGNAVLTCIISNLQSTALPHASIISFGFQGSELLCPSQPNS